MAKKKDYTSGDGLRQWVVDCGFESLHEGADALGVPHRTFDRWIADGVPGIRPAAIAYREHLVDKMQEIFDTRKKSQAKA